MWVCSNARLQYDLPFRYYVEVALPTPMSFALPEEQNCHRRPRERGNNNQSIRGPKQLDLGLVTAPVSYIPLVSTAAVTKYRSCNTARSISLGMNIMSRGIDEIQEGSKSPRLLTPAECKHQLLHSLVAASRVLYMSGGGRSEDSHYGIGAAARFRLLLPLQP